MELVRAIFFVVMELGVWLAEEVIDANATSEVRRLLAGLSFTGIAAARLRFIYAFFELTLLKQNDSEMWRFESHFLCF